jgi:GAF domain-containing protein
VAFAERRFQLLIPRSLIPRPLTLTLLAIRPASISSPLGSPLKVYLSTRQLLADVDRLLAANVPSAHHSPLQDVIDRLCRGRHYAWVGIFLAVGENQPQLSLGAGSDAPDKVVLPEMRSKILISMRMASREIGVLSVESERENAFSPQDRIFLEAVAETLARFLVDRGKYLARKARTDSARMKIAAKM